VGPTGLDLLDAVSPTAIVLTHAHPDHAAGLARGAPCPVFATRETWDLLHRFPVRDRRILPLNKFVLIDGVRVKAVPVEHSIRAPAVGYCLPANARSFFYVPDVSRLPNASDVLRGTDIYIGDGATLSRAMVRKRDRRLIGHASIIAQLVWCEKAGVGRAIFTHCGSQIVRGDARKLDAALRQLDREHGVQASFACDGDRLFFVDRRWPRWTRRHA
jgi:phosphoribosyl 1,2-cyclic phosphodiesterase